MESVIVLELNICSNDECPAVAHAIIEYNDWIVGRIALDVADGRYELSFPVQSYPTSAGWDFGVCLALDADREIVVSALVSAYEKALGSEGQPGSEPTAPMSNAIENGAVGHA